MRLATCCFRWRLWVWYDAGLTGVGTLVSEMGRRGARDWMDGLWIWQFVCETREGLLSLCVHVVVGEGLLT